MDRSPFEAQDIYDMDENGLNTVQTPKGVVTVARKKQVGSITSGQLVTMVGTINVAGSSIPSVFMLPMVKY